MRGTNKKSGIRQASTGPDVMKVYHAVTTSALHFDADHLREPKEDVYNVAYQKLPEPMSSTTPPVECGNFHCHRIVCSDKDNSDREFNRIVLILEKAGA